MSVWKICLVIFGALAITALGIDGAGLATLVSRLLLAIAMIIVVLKHKVFKPYISLRKQAWQIKITKTYY